MRPSRSTRFTLTTFLAAATLLLILPTAASAQQRPFEPSFEVSPANPSADSPVQVQIFFELKEGNSFLKNVAFRIPNGYQLTNSDDMPNNDIVGDGTLTLKVGSLGVQTPNLCLSNHAPNVPGAHSTINVAVQLGTGDSANCTGLLSLTFSLKRLADGQIGFEFSLPTEWVEQKLDTPVQLILNIYSVSKPNLNTKPQTAGGTPVIKNPKEPGMYEWKLAVDDIDGRHKDLSVKTRVDPAKAKKEKSKGTISAPVALGGAVMVLAIIGLVAYLIMRRRTPPGAYATSGQYDEAYYDAEYYAEDAGEHYYDQVPTAPPAPPGSPVAPAAPAAPAQPPGGYDPGAAGSPKGGYNPNAVDHGNEDGAGGQ